VTEEKRPPYLNVLSFTKEEAPDIKFAYTVEHMDGTIEKVIAEGVQFFPGVNFVFFTKEADDYEMQLDYAINLASIKSISVED
jgi:hypothetical protein